MRTRLGAAVTAMTALLASAAVAQSPAQDSVTGTGFAASESPNTLDFGFDFDVHSGPSGESPTGTVELDVEQLGVIRGPVTCLSVTGNVAVVKFSLGGPFPVILDLTVEDLPTGDLISVGDGLGDPTDCSESGGTTRRVVTGDVTVVDARPLPTASSDCKHGGWRSYGVFENQGDCVSFVATGGENTPGKP